QIVDPACDPDRQARPAARRSAAAGDRPYRGWKRALLRRQAAASPGRSAGHAAAGGGRRHAAVFRGGRSMIWRCDLVPQYLDLKAELDEAMTRVLMWGRYVLAENVDAFEREFASYVGMSHGV